MTQSFAKASGMMQAPMPGAPTFWLCYVVVADADASLAKGRRIGRQDPRPSHARPRGRAHRRHPRPFGGGYRPARAAEITRGVGARAINSVASSGTAMNRGWSACPPRRRGDLFSPVGPSHAINPKPKRHQDVSRRNQSREYFALVEPSQVGALGHGRDRTRTRTVFTYGYLKRNPNLRTLAAGGFEGIP